MIPSLPGTQTAQPAISLPQSLAGLCVTCEMEVTERCQAWALRGLAASTFSSLEARGPVRNRMSLPETGFMEAEAQRPRREERGPTCPGS